MRTVPVVLCLLLILPSGAWGQPLPEPCRPGVKTVRLEVPATVDQACGPGGCHALIPVGLRNCTTRSVALAGLDAVGERPRGTHETRFPPVSLAPGGAWAGSMKVGGPDRYRITAALRPGPSPIGRVEVLDAELERLVRECRACPWNQSRAPDVPCRARAERLALSAPGTAALTCAESSAGRTCRAAVPLVVRNCTGAPALLVAVGGRSPGGFLQGGPGWRPVPLARGATWTGSVEVRDAGPHEVWLTVRHPRFHAMNAPAARFRVRDPAREAAIRACARCRGTWGPQGILGRESCVCRTRDAGQRCFTAEDCASACVFHRFVVTRRAAGGQPARGITEGRCAPVTPLWSCWDVVHAGLSRSRPTPSPRYSRQCAD